MWTCNAGQRCETALKCVSDGSNATMRRDGRLWRLRALETQAFVLRNGSRSALRLSCARVSDLCAHCVFVFPGPELAQGDDEAAVVVGVFAGDQQEQAIARRNLYGYVPLGEAFQLGGEIIEGVVLKAELAEIYVARAVRFGRDRKNGEGDIAAVFIDGIEGYQRIGLQEGKLSVIEQLVEHGSVAHVVAIHDQAIIFRHQKIGTVQKQGSGDALLQIEAVVQIGFIVVFALHDGQREYISDAKETHRIRIGRQKIGKG